MLKRSQNIWQNFFLSSINFIHLTIVRWTDITYADCFKVIIFQKSDSRKMDVLLIFGSWDEEIDSGFTNHKLLISTLLP